MTSALNSDRSSFKLHLNFNHVVLRLAGAQPTEVDFAVLWLARAQCRHCPQPTPRFNRTLSSVCGSKFSTFMIVCWFPSARNHRSTLFTTHTTIRLHTSWLPVLVTCGSMFSTHTIVHWETSARNHSITFSSDGDLLTYLDRRPKMPVFVTFMTYDHCGILKFHGGRTS